LGEAQKKGFFGRWFGRKEGQGAAAVEEAVSALDQEGAEEVAESAPEDKPAPPGLYLAGGPAGEPAGEAASEQRAEEPAEEATDEAGGHGVLGRLRQGLAKTRQGFVQKVDRILFGKKEIDAQTLAQLEEALVTADLGVQTAMRLIEEIQEKVDRKELTSPEALRAHLKEAVLRILVADEGHFELGDQRPYVLMVVGVNGVGKTTTIGKLAAQFRKRGHKVILAAGDTFRAAAVEQLEIWGQRVDAQVVRHQHGSDPAAVAFDAVEAAKARGADLVIVDTAGRLHTKQNLMEELKKVQRVIGKALPGAPHEVLLVLDATTGQNAIAQAQIFHQAVGVDSLVLTKLDGTAKGGVIVGICDELKIPVQFIGIGEKVDDLRPFDARAFVEALF
jgi:fused signal recognition particle receptor